MNILRMRLLMRKANCVHTSSLDERGVELVLDILRERVEKHNECIFVISHRKESTKAATGDIIQLEKENGITRRVAYTG